MLMNLQKKTWTHGLTLKYVSGVAELAVQCLSPLWACLGVVTWMRAACQPGVQCRLAGSDDASANAHPFAVSEASHRPFPDLQSPLLKARVGFLRDGTVRVLGSMACR